MPEMTHSHSWLCRSAPWRTLARRVVLPWALQGFRPKGDVLEIGAGSGAMAAGLLAMQPDVHLTVTDVDHAMVAESATRLAKFGDRVTTSRADATALPFPDASFDAVLSWVMLHHTVEWETAVAEALRVLRPGGHFVGYDLLVTPSLSRLHQHDAQRLRVMGLPEFQDAVRDLRVSKATITPGFGMRLVRFKLQKD